MTLNPPRRARAVLYLIGTLGIIAVQWANDKHWLDSADRTALAGVLALIMALATANTFTPDATKRGEAGRVRPVLALVAAAVLAVAGALVALVPAPAQAYGWTAARCDLQTGNAAKVCVQIYTVPSGNGLRVNQIYLCAYKVPQLYFNGFQATKESTIQFWGSGGGYLGFINLVDTNASVGGTCAYTNAAFQMGNQACYHSYGKLDLTSPDAFYGIDGKVLGGAC